MRRTLTRQLACLAAVSGLAGVGTSANAFQLNFGEVSGRLDTTISFGTGWRLSKRDPRLVGFANGGESASINGDDGNLNYDRNSTPIWRAYKLQSELALSYGNFDLFIRSRYLFDSRNNDRNLHNSAARDEIGESVDLLESYIGYNFDILDRAGVIRIGKQSLTWGESLLTQHGVNEVTALNANRLRLPGFEITEVFVPAEMALINFDLTENIGVEAWYQFRWRRTQPDAVGSFLSISDVLGAGAEYVVVGFGRIPETQDNIAGNEPLAESARLDVLPNNREPKDSGQYGAAVRFFLERLNSTELVFYHANYHSRRPLGSAFAATGSANTALGLTEYPEDIQMFGLSFNTQENRTGIAIQGEFSHKRGEPLQVDDVELLFTALGIPIESQAGPYPGSGNYVQGFRRFTTSQYVLSASRLFDSNNIFRSDNVLLAVEAGASRIHNLGDTRLNAPGTPCHTGPEDFSGSVPGYCHQDEGLPGSSAWGLKLIMRLDYPNAFLGINVRPRMLVFWDVNGTTPDPLALYTEGAKQVILGSEFTYGNHWSADASIYTYFGGGTFNSRRDRDYISLSIKYSF